jgi:hypothetical protein
MNLNYGIRLKGPGIRVLSYGNTSLDTCSNKMYRMLQKLSKQRQANVSNH